MIVMLILFFEGLFKAFGHSFIVDIDALLCAFIAEVLLEVVVIIICSFRKEIF